MSSNPEPSRTRVVDPFWRPGGVAELLNRALDADANLSTGRQP
jgi:hypothetical protein